MVTVGRFDADITATYRVCMITTSELTDTTGLSGRTLTRWHKRGILPEPHVSTHPSGRGKIGYWPDWVLDRIQRIQELRREGHTLESAVLAIQGERVDRMIQEVAETPDFAEALKGIKVRLGDNREIDLYRIFVASVLAAVEQTSPDPTVRERIAARLREPQVRRAFEFFGSGFNPILVVDDEGLEVMPDFMVGHRLSSSLDERQSLIIVPLFPLLRHILGKHAKRLPDRPSTLPATKVRCRDGDVMMEYDIYLGGPLGFELIHSSGHGIGLIQGEANQEESSK